MGRVRVRGRVRARVSIRVRVRVSVGRVRVSIRVRVRVSEAYRGLGTACTMPPIKEPETTMRDGRPGVELFSSNGVSPRT